MKSIHYEICDSTNIRAKEYLKENPVSRLLITAKEQSAGRGRQGKSFYSPEDTGVYMTYAFKADLPLYSAVSVTTAAAAAVCRALETVSSKRLCIKWVNDIYSDGKKICGILTENIIGGDGRASYIIIGVGINIDTQVFPEDIKDIAGSLGSVDKKTVITAVTMALECIASAPLDRSFMDYYKSRSMVLGKDIIYTENGVQKQAKAVDIDNDGGLIVQTPDGNRQILRSGEISLRLKNNVQNFV